MSVKRSQLDSPFRKSLAIAIRTQLSNHNSNSVGIICELVWCNGSRLWSPELNPPGDLIPAPTTMYVLRT